MTATYRDAIPFLRRTVFSVIFAGIATAGAQNEKGIPVTDPLVIAKCGTCHPPDESGNLSRISWVRTTPEGWQNTIKRMVTVHGLTVTPSEARLVVRDLSANHGLAPEEVRPVMYEAERRIHEEPSTSTDALRMACAKCHSFAKVLLWRRSANEWAQFAASHAVDRQYPPDEETSGLLAKAAPLHTQEGDAWIARPRIPHLTGRWLVTASLPGRGGYYGEMQVERAGEDFTTRVNLTSLRDGSQMVRTGRAAVFGGYAWRGRSQGSASLSSAPDDLSSEVREVLWIAPDESMAEGRWFWGQYQEFGFDVKLQRASSNPRLLLLNPLFLKTGSHGNRIRIIGDQFPAAFTASDLAFGPGVTVRSIVSRAPGEIVVEADVAADAQLGKRDVAFRGSVLPGALALYDRVDYVKVIPESAVAAFGDKKYPRGYQQFEAIGYQRGRDGQARTADDVELGPVDVSWSMNVFHAPEGSSAGHVGGVDQTGLFTPASDNPNNNFDVWITATARDQKNAKGKPLVGKSYLVVTIPSYTFNGREYVRELGRWIDNGPTMSPAPARPGQR